MSEMLSTVERGDKWVEPAQETNTVTVWRQESYVHYRVLEDAETGALALLQKGASFAAICETIAIASSGPDQIALIGRLLARWLADGIIVLAEAGLP